MVDQRLRALRAAPGAHRLAVIPRVVTDGVWLIHLATVAYFGFTPILSAKFQVDLVIS